MITKKRVLCQEEKNKKDKFSRPKKPASYNKNSYATNLEWSEFDRELIKWFYSYLEDNRGTWGNPYYKNIIKIIQRGPRSREAKSGRIQNHIDVIRAVVEEDLEKAYKLCELLNNKE